ncbi:MAG: hypothetical protein QOJ29_2238 [Thermoleophilaceae bacterium]|jgi:hypothetical protein|nr:hypothetical protein [Thermoleophilaceae bacterium]
MSEHEKRPEPSLHAARIAEAGFLLQVNQMRRARGESTLVLVLVLSLLVAIVAVATRRTDPMLVLPPIALLLTSLSFQQYAEVTVLGAARARLEAMINEALGGEAMLYESYIAGIRKRDPLVGSVRVLQLLTRAATFGGVVSAR